MKSSSEDMKTNKGRLKQSSKQQKSRNLESFNAITYASQTQTKAQAKLLQNNTQISKQSRQQMYRKEPKRSQYEQEFHFHLQDEQPQSLNAKRKLQQFSVSLLKEQKLSNFNPITKKASISHHMNGINGNNAMGRSNNNNNDRKKTVHVMGNFCDDNDKGWTDDGYIGTDRNQKNSIGKSNINVGFSVNNYVGNNSTKNHLDTNNQKKLSSTSKVSEAPQTFNHRRYNSCHKHQPNYFTDMKTKVNLSFQNLTAGGYEIQKLREEQVSREIAKRAKSQQSKRPSTANYYAASQKLMTLYEKDVGVCLVKQAVGSNKKVGQISRIHSMQNSNHPISNSKTNMGNKMTKNQINQERYPSSKQRMLKTTACSFNNNKDYRDYLRIKNSKKLLINNLNHFQFNKTMSSEVRGHKLNKQINQGSETINTINVNSKENNNNHINKGTATLNIKNNSIKNSVNMNTESPEIRRYKTDEQQRAIALLINKNKHSQNLNLTQNQDSSNTQNKDDHSNNNYKNKSNCHHNNHLHLRTLSQPVQSKLDLKPVQRSNGLFQAQESKEDKYLPLSQRKLKVMTYKKQSKNNKRSWAENTFQLPYGCVQCQNINDIRHEQTQMGIQQQRQSTVINEDEDNYDREQGKCSNNQFNKTTNKETSNTKDSSLEHDFNLLSSLLKQENKLIFGSHLHTYLQQVNNNIHYNHYYMSTGLVSRQKGKMRSNNFTKKNNNKLNNNGKFSKTIKQTSTNAHANINRFNKTNYSRTQSTVQNHLLSGKDNNTNENKINKNSIKENENYLSENSKLKKTHSFIISESFLEQN